MKVYVLIAYFFLSSSLFAETEINFNASNHCNLTVDSYGVTTSKIMHTRGKVRDEVKLKGEYTFWICNTSKDHVTYDFEYNLSDERGNIVSKVDHISVKKYGFVSGKATSTLVTFYEHQGKYVIAATASIKNLHKTKSYDFNTVSIK